MKFKISIPIKKCLYKKMYKLKSLFALSSLILFIYVLYIPNPTSPDTIPLKKSYKQLKDHNPCMTQKFSADPGVMIYNNRIYIYSSNDGKPEKFTPETNIFKQIKQINIMSSDDLVNWSDHGSIPVTNISKWASNSYAPTAAHKKINDKEKFFIYFGNGPNGIGVLTADSPLGPFTDPLGQALITKQHKNCDVEWLFDPAVLVDDDGSGYLYFGGGIPDKKYENPGTLRAVKLGDDMISLSGDAVTIDAPWGFEDSGIHKKNGIYYYSYCTNFQKGLYGRARIAYMTSNNPLGPFTMKNACFENPEASFGTFGNNHHTIIEYNNKLYIFYHAEWLNKLVYGKQLGYRTIHVDIMPENGEELGLTKGTLTGVEQIKNFDPFKENKFNTMAWQAGINVYGLGDTYTEFTKGSWIGVSNVDFKEGAKEIIVKGGSKNGAMIKVCVGDPANEAKGYVSIPKTEDNWKFSEVKVSINGLNGVQNLFFVAYDDVLLNTYEFI